MGVAPAQTPGSVELSYRVAAGSGGSWTSTRLAGPPYELTGLTPGIAYEVRAAMVLSSTKVGPPSDATIFRTENPRIDALDMYRISENCGDKCQVDFLYDHDAGDLLSDVDFITHVANSSHFVSDFNRSVVTKYCVERAAEPFADCNRLRLEPAPPRLRGLNRFK